MWSARKFLWVFWTINFVVALVFSLTSVFNGKSIDNLYSKISDDDLTTNHLLGGLISTSAWGVVLVALFSVFSLIVLLRKVGGKGERVGDAFFVSTPFFSLVCWETKGSCKVFFVWTSWTTSASLFKSEERRGGGDGGRIWANDVPTTSASSII